MNPLSNDTNATFKFDFEQDKEGLSVFGIVWQTLYAICTFVPNLIVLFALLFKINERTYSNMCFISLTFCDLLVGMIGLPMNTLTAEVTMNRYIGMIVAITTYALPTVGLYTLILLGCHRLGQLIWPLASTEKIGRLRAFILISCWLFTFASWILIFIAMDLNGVYKSEFADFRPPAYVIIILDIFSYFLPMTVIFLITTATIVLLIKKRKKFVKKNSQRIISTNGSNNAAADVFSTIQNDQLTHKKRSSAEKVSLSRPRRSKLSRDQNAIMCLFTIIATNFLSQILYVIFWPLKHYDERKYTTIYTIANWVGYANSLMNPFILLAFNETIRKAVFSLFTCRRLSSN